MEKSLYFASVVLVSTQQLRPSQDVNLGRANSLSQQIEKHGVWSQALLITSNELVILDGHHRLRAAKQMSLSMLPCLLVDYSSGVIDSQAWDRRKSIGIQEVLKAALSGILLPAKTVRHKFLCQEHNDIFCSFTLDKLRK
jgi:L-serine kinase (ADP)